MEVKSYLIEAHIFRKRAGNIEFLLMKRAGGQEYPNIWQMVTGNIDQGEKAYETALREIKEETGLIPLNFWVAPIVNSFYSHKEDEICLVPVFAAEVSADSQIRISGEHSEFKWLGAEEAKKLLAWKGQRDSVDLILEYFLQPASELKFIQIGIR